MKFNVNNRVMATEAIAHQNKEVFSQLVEALKSVMGVKGAIINNKLIEKVGVNKILSDGLNGTFKVSVDDALYLNAWVYPPIIDASHALWNLKEYYNSPEATRFFLEQQKKHFKGEKFLTGTVDRANAKLGGDFSKIECPIWVTRGLLTHPQATPESIAFIILHECGHFFTYFEHFGRVNTFNGALQAASERFFKVDNQKDRLKVIHDMGDLVHLSADDKEALATAKDKEQFTLVIARSYIQNRNSTMGSDVYDMTLWESLSDQFASRMAPGKAGVEAMDLLYSDGTGRYSGMLSHIIFSFIKMMLFCLMTVATFGLALIILFINPAEKIYDAPKARMQRLRNDLVLGLKAPSLNKKLREEMLDDLKVIDEIMAKVEDYRGIMEFFYTSITSNGRREYTQLLFQRELEKLAANELIVSAAKLNRLSIKLS